MHRVRCESRICLLCMMMECSHCGTIVHARSFVAVCLGVFECKINVPVSKCNLKQKNSLCSFTKEQKKSRNRALRISTFCAFHYNGNLSTIKELKLVHV